MFFIVKTYIFLEKSLNFDIICMVYIGLPNFKGQMLSKVKNLTFFLVFHKFSAFKGILSEIINK